MNIHQFQASYQLEHDRVLVRMNTTEQHELRIWFTRRMMLGLFPHLEKASARVALPGTNPVGHDGAADQAIADYRRQETLEQTDFQTPFQSAHPARAAMDAPLLVTSVQITPNKNESLTIKLLESFPGTDQTRSMEINMGGPVLLGLMHVLAMALKASGWGVPALVPSEVAASGEGPKVPDGSDAFATALPPKYLN
jgi:hypothetical protein